MLNFCRESSPGDFPSCCMLLCATGLALHHSSITNNMENQIGIPMLIGPPMQCKKHLCKIGPWQNWATRKGAWYFVLLFRYLLLLSRFIDIKTPLTFAPL